MALKEWAAVSRAMEMGRQLVLLRKGGVSEDSATGEFTIAHREFLLFPTYLHQNKQMLKPSDHEGYEPLGAEPTEVTLSGTAVVTDIVRVTERGQIDRIDDEHVWTPPLIDMRFNYRPENPLYLLVLRAYRLKEPVTIANTPAYAGCKSWVPLEQEVQTGGALPVLDDVKFDVRRKGIMERLRA
jgi:hypothetical protein